MKMPLKHPITDLDVLRIDDINGDALMYAADELEYDLDSEDYNDGEIERVTSLQMEMFDEDFQSYLEAMELPAQQIVDYIKQNPEVYQRLSEVVYADVDEWLENYLENHEEIA